MSSKYLVSHNGSTFVKDNTTSLVIIDNENNTIEEINTTMIEYLARRNKKGDRYSPCSSASFYNHAHELFKKIIKQ